MEPAEARTPETARHSGRWRAFFWERHPKYWLIGSVLFLGRLSALLPFRLMLALGWPLGMAFYVLNPRLRRVATLDIARCFPCLTPRQRTRRVRASFRELGYSIMETQLAWYGNLRAFWDKRVVVDGLEHWQAALATGRGLILLSSHFGSLDLNAALAGQLAPAGRRSIGSYRAPADAVVDRFLRSVRARYGGPLYATEYLRPLLRELKSGAALWYAPDLDAPFRVNVFVDFFGAPASTSTITGRLAQSSGALVVPMAHYREQRGRRYRVKFWPALERFPSGDEVADARAVNAAVERIIEPYPERYWWMLKRFKRLPDGTKRDYSRERLADE
ncbi:MAG: lysophospholipid acyltransferase family protein [Chromatiales bacterium]|nr:lysophospholipid acyltransferase family protein [Chromatiales bacterium]